MDKTFITHKREPFFRIAKELIKEGDNILDIGAGNGDFADYCGENNIYLFDGNKSSVSFLRNKNYKNVYLGQLPDLPFKDEFFNIIHISHVVEHLQPQGLYDSLKEIDRCCRKGGRIVISTPLLWEGFYDDLSHVKPYNPIVFQKYLCGGNKENLTRQSISSAYKVEELVYRLKEKEWVLNLKRSKKFRILNKTYSMLRPSGFERYNRTGYTIVLKKQI